MKKIINIAFLFISINFYGQGNLQFNRVVTLSVSGTIEDFSQGTLLGTLNVPIGKVWKIEAVTLHRRSGPGLTGRDLFEFNNSENEFVLISDFVVWHPNNKNGYKEFKFHIWLNEGIHDIRAKYRFTVTGVLAISAIEFNIIP